MDVSPIQAAIQKGDAARVRELIAAEPALADARTEQGVSMTMLACYHKQPAIARIFEECGSVVDIFDASALGDEARVHALLGQFPESVDAYSQDGFYPLGLAAFFGHKETVKVLLEAGADVNQAAKNAFKVRPIHAAVSQGDPQIVLMLLDSGADARAIQQNGYTALHGAAGAGRLVLVDILLAHGADPMARSDDGKSSIDLAEERGHTDTAARLRSALL